MRYSESTTTTPPSKKPTVYSLSRSKIEENVEEKIEEKIEKKRKKISLGRCTWTRRICRCFRVRNHYPPPAKGVPWCWESPDNLLCADHSSPVQAGGQDRSIRITVDPIDPSLPLNFQRLNCNRVRKQRNEVVTLIEKGKFLSLNLRIEALNKSIPALYAPEPIDSTAIPPRKPHSIKLDPRYRERNPPRNIQFFIENILTSFARRSMSYCPKKGQFPQKKYTKFSSPPSAHPWHFL